MNAGASRTRPICCDAQSGRVVVLDQRRLPHETVFRTLATAADAVAAIRTLTVRGAPLIGVTGAWGVFLAARQAAAGPAGRRELEEAAEALAAARPTAVNLRRAVGRTLRAALAAEPPAERARRAADEAAAIEAEEIEACRRIGVHGLPLLEALAAGRRGAPVNVLTHCNAGRLACVEYGTATAPLYAAHEAGIALHVWVDETRPLNQGARLTAWELAEAGIPHTLIPDNAAGHLMQRGRVDLVIVGTDRTTAAGDVANKIGTYLKALAARDNGVPFYVALPASSLDGSLADGIAGIPIEERDPEEVRWVEGWDGRGTARVRICPEKTPAANFAFDVTPARLITGLITDRGLCRPDPEAIRRLFPDEAGGEGAPGAPC